MSRKIKEVIIGLPDSPVIKQDWDITPVVNTVTPDLIITGVTNAVANGDQVLVDVTGVSLSQYVSVAKTNIGLAGLGVNKTYRFGLEIDDVPLSTTPFAIGIYIAPSTLTEVQVKNEITSALFGGSGLLLGRIMHYVLSFNTTRQFVTSYNIANTATPTGINNAFTGIKTGMEVEVGCKTGLLISKRNNNLYLGRFDVNSDNVTYDLNGEEAVVNGPVLPETHGVFYFSLQANAGAGLGNIAFTPSLTVEPPSYDLAGTSAETNAVDWSNFANPERPSSSVTTQAVLPTDARIGQFYKTVINPSYTGPDPTPFGIPLKNNQTILINSISGNSASITAYVDNQTLVELVDDITQPIIDQQATMLQSIADLGDLIADAQRDVNMALLNAPEVIVYVKNQDISLPNATQEFTNAVTFTSFHDAYIYLLTLPVFIRKRIVFDDRKAPINLFNGTVGYLYNLIENNITLSSYMAFTELFPDYTWVSNRTVIQFDCTSLRLDRFVGEYQCLENKIPGNALGVNPLATDLLSRIQLDTNVRLITSDAYIDLTQQRWISMNNSCVMNLAVIYDPTLYQPLTIIKGKNCYLDLNYTVFPAFPNAKPWLYIQTTVDAINDVLSALSKEYISYTYVGHDPFRHDQSGSLIVVRDISQLGTPSPDGKYFLNNNMRYLFVKSLDLGDSTLYIPPNAYVELHALSSEIEIRTGQIKPTIENRGFCRDHGVTYKSEGLNDVPCILNNCSYIRSGGRIYADMLFKTIPDAFGSASQHIFRLDNVDHYHCTTGYYKSSLIRECRDFRLSNIKLHSGITSYGYLTFDINNVNIAQSYTVDGITGETQSTQSTRGVIDFTNMLSSSGFISNIFTFKNINVKTKGTAVLPLITRNGGLFNWKDNILFDYDDKQYKVLAITPSTQSRGSLVNAQLPMTFLVKRGFDVTGNGHMQRYAKNELTGYYQYFKVTIKGKVFKTTSSAGDARILAMVLKEYGIGDFNVFNITVPLPSANTQVAFEKTVVISLTINDTVAVYGSLSTSTLEYVNFVDLEYSIDEL